MKSCFRRCVLVVGMVFSLVGCGHRETDLALQKASALEEQKQYENANDVLVAALQAREAQIRAKVPEPTDPAGVADLTKKVQADSEILKMERAQIPIYLHVQRPDLAAAVYADILSGDPNTTVVYDILKDPDPEIRLSAIRVLVLAGQSSAIDALAGATKDSNQDVRRAAVAALGTIKDPRTVPPLIAALKDSFWFARSEAADALGREQDESAINPLFDAVEDPDKSVETSAENSLVSLSTLKGTSGDDYAQRMNDPDPKIAAIAAVCLALQKDRRATPVLLKMAASSDEKTRLQAVKALGESGDASAIPTVRQTLKDSDVNVRGWSIISLGKLNDQASIPTLKAIAADAKQPQNIRNAATAAINYLTKTAGGAGTSSSAAAPPAGAR